MRDRSRLLGPEKSNLPTLFPVLSCSLPENLIQFLCIIIQGFISSFDGDEIMKGLEKIEDEIEDGKFEWRENKDVRSNVVQALIDRVGEPARKLDATLSQHVQKLSILQMWLCDSVDKIVTQIKTLQVNLCSLLFSCDTAFVLATCTCQRKKHISCITYRNLKSLISHCTQFHCHYLSLSWA